MEFGGNREKLKFVQNRIRSWNMAFWLRSRCFSCRTMWPLHRPLRCDVTPGSIPDHRGHEPRGPGLLMPLPRRNTSSGRPDEAGRADLRLPARLFPLTSLCLSTHLLSCRHRKGAGRRGSQPIRAPDFCQAPHHLSAGARGGAQVGLQFPL